MTAYIGKRVSRVDGRAKVTGEAKYAGEHHVPNLAYGQVISSAVAKGRITRIDASLALALPGVLQVFTHENTPRLARSERSYRDDVAPPGSPFRPLHDDEIKFSGQPIALVVAETFELARYAATLVRIEYHREPHATDLEEQRSEAHRPRKRTVIDPLPPPRGDADKAFARAAVRVDAEYHVPVEHHNPMEPFATTVVRDEDGTLTVYDKTQGVQNVHGYLCRVFDRSKDEVRVLSPFVGGAFGSGLRPQYQVFMAVLAAMQLKRSVKVTLTRQQMFTLGHRPTTIQRVALGARTDGKMEAIIHEIVAETSSFEDYSEDVVNWSGLLYRCDNVRLVHEVARLDLNTPCDMRAPGAAWGIYALECAMDELAVKLGSDPLELRLRNYTERDQIEDKPFSSKELRACYRVAAEKFGWARRDPTPGSMRNGAALVGWGMATGMWEAKQIPAAARALLTADCRLTVASATADIGTGTYTIMTQIAAELLGLPLESVTFKLGDSSLPKAPVEGGSFTAATVGSAVHAVCHKLRARLFKLARRLEGSPLAGAKLDDVIFAGREIRLRSDPTRAVSLVDVVRSAEGFAVEEKAASAPGRDQERYSRYAHSAVFAEVEVDRELGSIRVTRVVSALACGRILNPKTSESQVIGGIVWGIGMALEEESVIDQAFGRFMNHNLAEYHVPVNADVHDLEVCLVEEHDTIVNPLGVKGLGEIGLVGVAAAIANAVYHATGKRIRELPITLDKLL
jgi:xanthine dehydrogenase YagR molybdenum-binding subunit